MVVSVGYNELTDSIDRHSCQAVEFTLSASVRSELFRENTVRIKDL